MLHMKAIVKETMGKMQLERETMSFNTSWVHNVVYCAKVKLKWNWNFKERHSNRREVNGRQAIYSHKYGNSRGSTHIESDQTSNLKRKYRVKLIQIQYTNNFFTNTMHYKNNKKQVFIK